MPPIPSRNLVLKKLHDCFPDPAAAADALRSLDRYQGMAPNSVHLAIIKLSEGALWRLRDYVKIARKRDPRDVLYAAGSPEQFANTKKIRPLLARRLKVKPLSAAKEAAMRRRDEAQWIKWLESSEA